MIKIEDPYNDDPDYWISRDKLILICDEVPSLFEIKDSILNRYDAWAPNNDPSIKGDIPVWTLRESFRDQGFYSDATVIEQFCKKANSELLLAVDSGHLSFDSAIHISTQSRGIYVSEIPKFIKSAVNNLVQLTLLNGISVDTPRNEIPYSTAHYMQSVAGVTGVNPISPESVVYGWLILKGSPVCDLELKILDGDYKRYAYISSGEDTSSFLPEYAIENRSRFQFSWSGVSDLSSASIQIWNNDILIGEYPLQDIDSDRVFIHIDYIGQSDGVDEYETMSSRITSLYSSFIRSYRYVNYLLILVSILGFLFLTVTWLKEKNWYNFSIIIVLAGLLLSMFAFELGISIFTSWLGDSSMVFYSISTVFSHLQLFILISIFSSINKLCNNP